MVVWRASGYHGYDQPPCCAGVLVYVRREEDWWLVRGVQDTPVPLVLYYAEDEERRTT